MATSAGLKLRKVTITFEVKNSDYTYIKKYGLTAKLQSSISLSENVEKYRGKHRISSNSEIWFSENSLIKIPNLKEFTFLLPYFFTRIFEVLS